MSLYSVGMHLMNINPALGSGLQSAGVVLVGRCYGNNDIKEIKATTQDIFMIGVTSALIGYCHVLYNRIYSTIPDPEDCLHRIPAGTRRNEEDHEGGSDIGNSCSATGMSPSDEGVRPGTLGRMAGIFREHSDMVCSAAQRIYAVTEGNDCSPRNNKQKGYLFR